LSETLWAVILGGILTLIGAGISPFKDMLRHEHQRKKDAAFLAVRVVCILNEFVNKCVEVIYDDGTKYGRGSFHGNNSEEYFTPLVSAPKTIEYPADLDWKSIDTDLMYRILSLPTQVKYVDDVVKQAHEISGPPDFDEVFEARYKGYSDLGLEAIYLIERLWIVCKITPDNHDAIFKSIHFSKETLISKKDDLVKLEVIKAQKQHDFLNKMKGAIEHNA
jgi:hypothetical protein